MSITEQTFIPGIGTLNDERQTGLMVRLMELKPQVTFDELSRQAYLRFPDSNAPRPQPEREGYSVTFMYPVRAIPDDARGWQKTDLAVQVCNLFVEIRQFILETQQNGSLEEAIRNQGTVEATFLEHMAGVEIGRWLLIEGLISEVILREERLAPEQPATDALSITVEFNGYLK